MNGSPESMSDEQLRTYLTDYNYAGGPEKISLMKGNKYTYIPTLNREELLHLYNTLQKFYLVELPSEEEKAWIERETPGKVRHIISGGRPRPAFATFLCQCQKCLLIESIDARRNGIPGGLQLEPGNRVALNPDTGKLTHRPAWKCGGKVKVFGKMPEGYSRLY